MEKLNGYQRHARIVNMNLNDRSFIELALTEMVEGEWSLEEAIQNTIEILDEPTYEPTQAVINELKYQYENGQF
jgi:hypothetical protein